MATTINDIKNQLQSKDKKELIAFLTRLARFKKENKELLTFLLYDANNPDQFLIDVKNEISQSFTEINYSSVYFIKKSLRKILRVVNKYIRFAGDKQLEAAVLMHFCECIKEHPVPLKKSVQLQNIYDGQRKKLTQAIQTLHPDLQYDLLKQAERL